VTALALVIVIVGFIVAAHQVMARAEAGASELGRLLREIDGARSALARKAEDLVASAKGAEESAARYEEEAAALSRDAEAAAAALERLLATPREKVYVSDRNPSRSQRLWEVAVAHDGLSRHPAEAFARSWSTGRRYVLSAETEKLARQRAELRFPGVQGFRILGVKPASF
jgi:hypothetical protein